MCNEFPIGGWEIPPGKDPVDWLEGTTRYPVLDFQTLKIKIKLRPEGQEPRIREESKRATECYWCPPGALQVYR